MFKAAANNTLPPLQMTPATKLSLTVNAKVTMLAIPTAQQ